MEQTRDETVDTSAPTRQGCHQVPPLTPREDEAESCSLKKKVMKVPGLKLGMPKLLCLKIHASDIGWECITFFLKKKHKLASGHPAFSSPYLHSWLVAMISCEPPPSPPPSSPPSPPSSPPPSPRPSPLPTSRGQEMSDSDLPVLN